MRRLALTLSLVALIAGVVAAPRFHRTVAQEAPTTADHPIIGSWIVDTVSAADTDSPEVGLFLPGGGMVGQGANRVAGGSWEVVDDRTVMMTLVTVADAGGAGSYVVVRGPHTLDETGDAWTCACTFTVVAADGTVLDSGDAPASARRLPVQGPELVGTALDVVPVWSPVQPEATPQS